MRRSLATIFAFVLFTLSPVLGQTSPTVDVIDLATLRDIGGHGRGAINVSPDGTWVAFQLQTPNLADGDYQLTWMAIRSDRNEVRKVADGGDVLLNPVLYDHTVGNMPPAHAKWSPDSKSFIYTVRRHGQTQLWRSWPDKTGQVQLTHGSADVIDFSWSPDGLKVYFSTSIDPSQLEMRKKEEGAKGFLYDDRFDPWLSAQPSQRNCIVSYGRPVAFSLARACDPDLWILELKTQDKRLATEEEKEAFNRLDDGVPVPEEIADRKTKNLRRSRDGTGFAWLENTDPKIYQGAYPPLTVFSLVDGEVRQCSNEACRAYDVRGHQDMWWNKSGQEVVFLRRDGPSHSMTGLYAWSPLTGNVRRLFQSDEWLSECAPSGDRLICLYENWKQPRKIVSVSLDDGSITALYDPNPEFLQHRFSRIEKLEWTDAYGNSTYGHLVYPIDYQLGRTYPLIFVTYQSRGFLRGGVGDEYPIFPLAAEGVFVLSQEMPFDMELVAKAADLNAALFKDQYERKSVLSSQVIIADKLVESGLVDKARIAITGLSEGQAQVSYGLINSDIFATAIASGAWESPSSYYLVDNKAREWQRSSFGAPDDPDSMVQILSIGLNADRVNAPLLINGSDQEFLGAVENIARLNDAGKPVEMYVFPGEYHIKWQPDHRRAIYRRNIQWLKFWLKGEEEDNPVSPGQYERWRDMRDKRCAWDEPSNEKPAYCAYSPTKQ